MNDTEFAIAVEEFLRITPSGSQRDNERNLKAVKWSLEERNMALAALKDLADVLFPGRSWYEDQDLAVPLLAALLIIKEHSGQ